MTNSVRRATRTRRVALRSGAIAAVAVTALAGLGVSAASAADSAAPTAAAKSAAQTAVGTWQVKGVANGNVVEPVYYFYADGTFKMIPEDNAYVGTGTWQLKDDGTFTFHLEHPIYVDGKETFRIVADQTGTLKGDTFSTSGISHRTDLDGNVLETFDVTITGKRIAK
ncbi:hypothetical protein AB0B50_13240 [Streptomyces sp. NPDC041068]|uniref:hypothetical protein n=1 Tax=Streptomyces sp. NPDC041068 TaxID=3155130 RepID=UPI0033C7C986